MSLFGRKPRADGAADLRVVPSQRWGQPGRCPACGGHGYLDRIDLVDRVMYQHCVDCRGTWETAELDLGRAE